MSVINNDTSKDDTGTFLDRLGHTLTQQPFYHAGGWLAFLVLLVLMQWRIGDFSFGLSAANEAINIVFYIIVVYINLLYPVSYTLMTLPTTDSV